MKQKKAIIFDLEGVLIDTERLWDLETKELLMRRGIIYNREEIKHLLSGHALPEGVKRLKAFYGLTDSCESLVDERYHIMEQLIDDQICYFAGVVDMVNALKKSYQVVVATAMDDGLLQKVDEKLGLYKLFSNQVYSVANVNNVSKHKPDLFKYVLNHIKVDANVAIVVEDSPSPIIGAHLAGIEVVGVATTYSADKLHEADYVLEFVTELPALLT